MKYLLIALLLTGCATTHTYMCESDKEMVPGIPETVFHYRFFLEAENINQAILNSRLATDSNKVQCDLYR